MSFILAGFVLAALVTAAPVAADDPSTTPATESQRPVELLSQRTETTQVFANPDGTRTLKQFAAPVRVEQDGEWVDVDYDLARNADGTYSPKAAPADVTVGGGGSATAATVDFDGDKTLSVTWPGGNLPKPTIEGGVATYKISDSTDLLVVVTGSGVATRIRLNEAPTASDDSWRLGLRAENLEVDESGSHELKFTDEAGRTVGSTSGMTAWDALTDPAGDPARIVPIEAELTDVSSRGDVDRHNLDLTAPETFLNDPNTQYPVVIDPDINAVFSQDTWVRPGTAASYATGAGYYYRLMVGRITNSESAERAISYLQWSNSHLSGKPIISAEMGLWQYDSGSCSARQMNVYALSSGFNNSTTYETRPSARSEDATNTTYNPGGSACTTSNDWVRLNVTAMAKKWAAGSYPNYGVRLNVPEEYNGSTLWHRRFCSSQPDSSQGSCKTASTVPFLKITWNYAPATPTSLTGTPCTSCTADPLVLTSANPTFTAVTSDPDGGAGKVEFEIYDGHSTTPTTKRTGGSGTVPNAATSVPATSRTAKWTAPTLPNGSYSIRARSNDNRSTSAYTAWKRIKVAVAGGAMPGTFVATTPTVVADTTSSTPLGANTTRDFTVAGTGGVPSTATAVAIETRVTTSTPETGGLTLFTAGTTRPSSASMSIAPTATTADDIQFVQPGSGGNVSVYNSGGTRHLKLTVLGYFTPPTATSTGGWTSDSTKPATGVSVPVNGSRALNVRGTDLPTQAAHVLAKITISGATSAGTVSLKSASGAETANVSYPAGGATTRTVLLRPDSNGQLTASNTGTSTASVDLETYGYFSDQPSAPFVFTTRRLDALADETLSAGQADTVQTVGSAGLPPSEVTAVALTVTVRNPTASGRLTVIDSDDGDESSTHVPFTAGTGVVSRTVVVGTSFDGAIDVINRSAGTAQVSVTVQGWFSDDPTAPDGFVDEAEDPTDALIEDDPELEAEADYQESVNDRTDAVLEAADDDINFVGASLDYSTKTLELYGSGDLPTDVESEAAAQAATDFDTDWNQVPFSSEDLDEASEAVFQSSQHIAEVSIGEDFASLEVTQAQDVRETNTGTGTTTQPKSTEELVAEQQTIQSATTVPLTFADPEPELTAAPARGRTDDRAPFAGGAKILRPDGVGCSTAFGIKSNKTGRLGMLYAQHCQTGVGKGTQWRTPQNVRYAKVSSKYVTALDGAALTSIQSSSSVYTGKLAKPSQTRKVAGATRLYKGKLLCASGSYSGRRCGIRIMRTGVKLNYGDGMGQRRGLIKVRSARNQSIWGQGDSGGPVWNARKNYKITAAGVISGVRIKSGDLRDCAEGNNSRYCSEVGFFAPVQPILNTLGASLITG